MEFLTNQYAEQRLSQKNRDRDLGLAVNGAIKSRGSYDTNMNEEGTENKDQGRRFSRRTALKGAAALAGFGLSRVLPGAVTPAAAASETGQTPEMQVDPNKLFMVDGIDLREPMKASLGRVGFNMDNYANKVVLVTDNEAAIKAEEYVAQLHKYPGVQIIHRTNRPNKYLMRGHSGEDEFARYPLDVLRDITEEDIGTVGKFYDSHNMRLTDVKSILYQQWLAARQEPVNNDRAPWGYPKGILYYDLELLGLNNDDGREGLVIATCDGRWIKTSEYTGWDHRKLVVFEPTLTQPREKRY